MSFRKNTLNIQSTAYNAATDTPSLAVMVEAGIYEVTTAGRRPATVIDGASSGADSYLLAGDKVLFRNGALQLLNREIKNNTNITVGTGGLFANFYSANEYIKQRIYSSISITLLSATVETQSVDVSNTCGGDLKIYSAGFLIDFSATLGINLKLGHKVYVDNLKVKANISNGGSVEIHGEVSFDNSIDAENISGNAQAQALKPVKGFLCGKITGSTISSNANIIVKTPVGFAAYSPFAMSGFTLHVNNITSTADIRMGNSTTNRVDGTVNTGGGGFSGGNSCSNCFNGSIVTGGGAFSGGNSCNNYFVGAISTAGGAFNAGTSCSNYFGGLVSVGAGVLDFASSLSNWVFGATGTGGVDATGGSRNRCNGQAMPAGTPATGTNTAAFSRVS